MAMEMQFTPRATALLWDGQNFESFTSRAQELAKGLEGLSVTQSNGDVELRLRYPLKLNQSGKTLRCSPGNYIVFFLGVPVMADVDQATITQLSMG